MGVVMRAQERRKRLGGPVPWGKNHPLRPWIEPPLIMAGAAIGKAVSLLPSEWSLKVHDGFFRALSGRRSLSFDERSPAMESARGLLRRLDGARGRCPILALTSHPDPWGEEAALNFDLMHVAMHALQSLRGPGARPRLVVAIDPFALDTVGLHMEGLYAGAMSGYRHLVLDRMCHSRGAAGRFLLSGAAWPSAAGRLLGELRAGGEIVMVLAGGVPTTARLLYAVREWVWRSRLASPRRSEPTRIRRELQKIPEFADLGLGRSGRPLGGRNLWRHLEMRFLSIFGGLEGCGTPEGCLADTGRVCAAERRLLDRFLDALGLGTASRLEAIGSLEAEAARETPYRTRFFRLLARRLLPHGPLLFLPLRHRAGVSMRIDVGEPWAWEGPADGGVAAIEPGIPPRHWFGGAEEFARRFVEASFA